MCAALFLCFSLCVTRSITPSLNAGTWAAHILGRRSTTSAAGARAAFYSPFRARTAAAACGRTGGLSRKATYTPMTQLFGDWTCTAASFEVSGSNGSGSGGQAEARAGGTRNEGRAKQDGGRTGAAVKLAPSEVSRISFIFEGGLINWLRLGGMDEDVLKSAAHLRFLNSYNAQL
jgi:hypothetical protein